MISRVILKLNNVKESGKTFIALWMMIGFAMFGKNILNVWPLIIGEWIYGVIAGGLYVILALNIASINGGINLYNNGFASGLVTIILGSIIMCIKKEKNIVEDI